MSVSGPAVVQGLSGHPFVRACAHSEQFRVAGLLGPTCALGSVSTRAGESEDGHGSRPRPTTKTLRRRPAVRQRAGGYVTTPHASDAARMPPPTALGGGLGDQVYNRLLGERIIFLGQAVDDDIANKISAQLLLLAAEPGQGHLPLHQLAPAARSPRAWRSTTPCSTSRTTSSTIAHGPGRLDGPVPADRGHPGQALRAAERRHPDAPALGGPRRLRLGHQDPGRAAAAHQEAHGRADRPAHRPDRRDRSPRTPTATAGSPPEEAKDYGLIDEVMHSAADVPGGGGTGAA